MRFSAPNWILPPHGIWGGCPECPREGGRKLTKRGHTRLNLPHGTPSGPTLPLVLLLCPGPSSRSGLLSTPTLGFLLDSWAAMHHPCYPAVALTKPLPPHPLAAKGGLRCMKPLGPGCHSCWGSEGGWHWASGHPEPVPWPLQPFSILFL